jgi:hypothetical protein
VHLALVIHCIWHVQYVASPVAFSPIVFSLLPHRSTICLPLPLAPDVPMVKPEWERLWERGYRVEAPALLEKQNDPRELVAEVSIALGFCNE